MILDLTKNQSVKPQPNLSSHPDIQEYHHTHILDDSSLSGTSSFLELTIRNEGFKSTPYSLDDIIHF